MISASRVKLYVGNDCGSSSEPVNVYC